MAWVLPEAELEAKIWYTSDKAPVREWWAGIRAGKGRRWTFVTTPVSTDLGPQLPGRPSALQALLAHLVLPGVMPPVCVGRPLNAQRSWGKDTQSKEKESQGTSSAHRGGHPQHPKGFILQNLIQV